MNDRIRPEWSSVKDCSGKNLHLFDSVQVLTSDNEHKNQTGRILAFLKTKPYLQMVEVLFGDGARANFLTTSLGFVEESEDKKGKALLKIDSLRLMGAEITAEDFYVDENDHGAFQFDDETQSWNVPLVDACGVDRVFGTHFETRENESFCNVYADVNKHCTKLANPYLTVSLWLDDTCPEARRYLTKNEQKAVLSAIRKAYAKSDCEVLLKQWSEETE